MDIISIFNYVINFIKDIYHAGGAHIRWVIWIWAVFIFLYLLLGKYDKIHNQKILANRKKICKNYFYTLHTIGIISIVIEYAHLLYGVPCHLPFAKKIISIRACSVLGFALLIIGLGLVIEARLYLNSYWGKDIYSYEDVPEYRLVTDHIYKKMRHPIYFGQILMFLGTAFALNEIIFIIFSIIIMIANFIRAKREEKYLEECFKDEWKKYKDNTYFWFPV